MPCTRIALRLQHDSLIRRFRGGATDVQYLSRSALYATQEARDSLFTLPGFLRKMAFSHAAPSPENRCFVRLGLARALLDSPSPRSVLPSI